jgi:hypothetical protein
MDMKNVTLTVEITVRINEDTDPNDITFRGIEAAVPVAHGYKVGTVYSYCTQEYHGEE